jgi:hypothetical protein
MTEHDQLLSQLKQAVAAYLDSYVVGPAVELVSTDFTAQDDVASLLVLHRLLREAAEASVGKPVDQYLQVVLEKGSAEEEVELPELLSRLAEQGGHIAELRAVFCSYVFNLANSVCVSILSASYLGAFIVTRALLELLVGVGSGRTGPMAEKIEHLTMLAPNEKKVVSECWRELSGWTHPHKRWLKNLCPVLVAKGPLHHPKLTRECLAYLGICTDLAFAIGVASFGLNAEFIRDACIDQHVDYRRFMLLYRRIQMAEAG